MNKTNYAKLSIILISLVYFLPIISILMTKTDPLQTFDPILIIISFILTIIILILPGLASFLYTRTVPKISWKIHLTAITIIFAGIIYLLSAGANFSPDFTQMILASSLIFYLPLILLCIIPVWFTISYPKESYKPLKLFGILTPILLLAALIMMIILPDCPVGESPAYTYAEAQIILFAAELFSVIAGIVLIYLGLKHPEVSLEKT